MKPVDYFNRDLHTFWATTFQLDLKLFDQFLLRRLGHEPLNAVVLCDAANLSAALSRLSEVDQHVVASANSRYVLRGMKVPSGGRFHPKTYLFASNRRVQLLVGSGNLTWSGIDRGAEVFAEFDAADQEGRAVIRDWLDWMATLVEARNDELLTHRFRQLRQTLSVLDDPGAESSSTFASNADTPLLETIKAAAPAGVQELHVTAPYFDNRAEALNKLIKTIEPTRSVHLYLGARPNVDGRLLQAILAGIDVNVKLYRLHPTHFVHAKMIGLVADQESVLVCGSANLSHAALDRIYASEVGRGNCEAVVIRRGDAESVRSRFRLRDAEPTEMSIDDLAGFTFDSEEEGEIDHKLSLISVAPDSAARLIVKTEGPLAAGARLQIGDDDFLSLDRHEDSWTTPSLDVDSIPLVAWLADTEKRRISNMVVVDDPRALERMLGERTGSQDVPNELRGDRSGSDFIELLLNAHRQQIFDLDDTRAVAKASQQADSNPDAPDGYWDRYASQEIQYDQRSQTYRPLSKHAGEAEPSFLMSEIRAMLNAAPGERHLRLIRNVVETEMNAPEARREWTPTARERVRARNLIRRWARAIPDPRHVWLAEDAAARNYEVLIELLATTWLKEYLPNEDVVELFGEVLGGLLGTSQGKGLLGRAEPDVAESVLGSIGTAHRELAAAMAFCALTQPKWREFVYEWQYFMKLGLEEDVFAAGDLAMAFVEAETHESTTSESILELLAGRATYVDDETWGRQIAETMGLSRVRLSPAIGFNDVDLMLEIEGVPEPDSDPRLVSLARRALEFKRSGNVLISAADQRYLLRLGEKAVMRVNRVTRTSIEPIDLDRLYAVEEQGGNLSDLLGVEAT